MKAQIITVLGAVVLGLSVAAWAGPLCTTPAQNPEHGGKCILDENGNLACRSDYSGNGFCSPPNNDGNEKCALQVTTFTYHYYSPVGVCSKDSNGNPVGTCNITMSDDPMTVEEAVILTGQSCSGTEIPESPQP